MHTTLLLQHLPIQCPISCIFVLSGSLPPFTYTLFGLRPDLHDAVVFHEYLLHVIPPHHLPHDSDVLSDAALAPPPSASGYHTQFRRGVLVPVYPTLSSQLAAIAKEYALPSTVGMILYLITSTPKPSPSPVPGLISDVLEEPGPRISEDIWRHIWFRVIKAEKDDSLPSGPRPIGLGIGVRSASESSPALLQDVMSNSLHPLMSPRRTETPQPIMGTTPSPSTPSHSGFSSQSELDTPESFTSASAMSGLVDDLPLPGLSAPALIPVLAKVEFDIDRRKAGWYESWLRSRRANHAKRAESRVGTRKRAGSRIAEEDDSDTEERRAPLDLKLVGRMRSASAARNFLSPKNVDTEEDEYAQLPDDDDGEDATARLGASSGSDPLADVFGTDAEAWAQMHAGHPARRARPGAVELALDGAALAALPDKLSDDEHVSDGDEVAQLWDRHARPSLIVEIPSPKSASKHRSSPTTAGTIRRQPPPPLELAPALPSGVAIQLTPSTAGMGSSRLPYLGGISPPTSEETDSMKGADYVGISMASDGESSMSEDERPGVQSRRRVRSYQEEKREGAFFEDLDLGIEDSTEFDDSDPHDRRRSQLVMKAQLDEIERNLAQFSPRRMLTEDLPEERTHTPGAATLSPPSRGKTPRLKEQADSSPLQSYSTLPEEGASWPAVPFSHVNGRNSVRATLSAHGSAPSSPPRIAFNGVSTEPPKSPFAKRTQSGTISDETLARIREQEEAALYPPLVAPTLFKDSSQSVSPIIPLSPDPFGRFPSEAEATRLNDERHQSGVYPDKPQATRSRGSTFKGPPPGSFPAHVEHERASSRAASSRLSQAPSSRFSFDSATSEDVVKGERSTPLVSMKSIKKLWRRTNGKLSMSATLPDSGRSSPNNAQDVRQTSNSPQLDDVQPPPVKPRRKISVHSMHFNQDSPYPVIPSRTLPLSDSSRQASPMPPPIPSRTPPLDISRQASPALPPMTPPLTAAALPEKNVNVRKSILKSWRSTNGNLSVSASTTSQSSTEQLSQDAHVGAPPPVRRRKSSVFEGLAPRRSSLVSTVSASTTLVDLPPSPALPDVFTLPKQPRSSLRQSQLMGGGKRTSVRQRSTGSSTDSSSSPPHASRFVQGGPASPPRNGSRLTVSRSSGESGESRPSLDVSQFEMVSPRKDAFVLESTLSYPYHALDHSMSSDA
ncbi:hypothetical protein B0H21DRAFT_820195 [Amylocystis lapponica]|nr:hypothetical protein B0H21DRAFT_820195 [Amylocystis lapponica]